MRLSNPRTSLNPTMERSLIKMSMIMPSPTFMNEDLRKAQDSFMFYDCLMNSLTDAAQKQVRTWGNVLPFMFGGKKGSGPVLLKKVIISVSHVDTRATTVTSVRTKLSSLDHAM